MTRGKIAEMLRGQKKHLSFHTPGHKRAGADITELSYSDNLFSPHGVILQAEKEIAGLLGAGRTFFLTGGSTVGVHAMLYALKARGVKSVALSPYSHPSVVGGCRILDLTCVYFPTRRGAGIPLQPTREDMEQTLQSADALFLTSPDYYGFFPDLDYAKELCAKENKPLVIDGAHGSHLHFTKRYAGRFADMWVDGVHKSLPALTQGAAVSCTRIWEEPLAEGVRLFHTSSPSYPILASVEEAYLCPRNPALEEAAQAFKLRVGALANEDWSKVVVPFGEYARTAQSYLEQRGVYAEFNDGNYLMFYLSPCTNAGALKKLERLLAKIPRAPVSDREEDFVKDCDGEIELVALSEAVGRICAEDCGIFPPSLPVVRKGERISEEAVRRLNEAVNTYGLYDGKIKAYTQKP